MATTSVSCSASAGPAVPNTSVERSHCAYRNRGYHLVRVKSKGAEHGRRNLASVQTPQPRVVAVDGLCIRFWATGTSPHAYYEVVDVPHEGTDRWWMDTELRVDPGVETAERYDVERINRNGVVLATSSATANRLANGKIALRGLAGFISTADAGR